MKRRLYGFIKLLVFMPTFAAVILSLAGLFIISPLMVLVEPRLFDDLVRSLEGD